MRLSPAIGLLVLSIAAPLAAQTKAGNPANGTDPRRTPIVEVYERWKNSVAYLTGPAATAPGPAIDEFFQMPPGTRQTISIGSGFVVHESGYIITNAHAVEKVISPFAALGGWGAEGELVGIARDKDLALVKIPPIRQMRAVQLAKSGDVLVGETVIVIGNPGGLMDTVTAGILSGTGRSSQPANHVGPALHNMLQTDAGVNPGNSGGPWFNVLGQVIGVTTATKAGAQNISFAVPVSAVREMLPPMLDVERRYGLVTGLEMRDEPCMLTAVAAESPGATAGLQPGDVLARLDGRVLYSRADFDLALVGRKPGETLKLQLWRKEKFFETTLVLGARPKPDGAAMLRDRYGLAAVPLTDDKARTWGLRVRRGVIITAVAKLYDKMEPKPMPGDVLARIGDYRPKDLDQVGIILDRIKVNEATNFVLLRKREGTAIRVDLKLTLRSQK